MPDDSDPTSVQAPAELRNGSLDDVKLVEDALHILNADRQNKGAPGVFGSKFSVLELRWVGWITTKP
jgi:hypothetical protein